MNSITIAGTLGRDPELRYVASGRAVANFSVAVSRRYQVNNEWQEQTSWVNVTCWGDMAENVGASLTKGARVIVSGRLETREYEKDGQKRTATDLIADEIGPSLRWARAEVERVAREDATASRSGSRNRAPDPVYGDEEAF